jgi:hypothetical protein
LPKGNKNVLQNLKVHYRVHKSLLLVPILSHVNPVHTPHFISLRSISILFSYLNSGLFPAGFLTKTLYALLFPACYISAHLILDLIVIIIIFGEEYKL